ncbi:hypothetical protein GF357_02310 [Candidatus Dojkabacteria bacterium]|nr:hypothetical protein [Candidatus Dojkabacteria bacterium]
MKRFKYQAKTKAGAISKGVLEAKSKQSVVESLQSRGLVVLSVSEEIGLTLEKLQQINIGNVPIKEIVIFMRQFATMISAGLPLTQSLRILGEQARNPKFKAALETVLSDVEGGVSLAKALKRTSNVFDEITINLIEAGEESGNLEDIMKRLAEEIEKKKKLRDKVRSAMTYPALTLVTLIGAVVIMMVVLVPALEEVYSSFGDQQLPAITRMLIWISNTMFSYWWLIAIVLALLGIGLKLYLDTPKGKRFFAMLSIKMPVIGPLIVNIQLSQFTRVLSLLLSSGLSIIQALQLTANSLNNILFREAVLNAIDDVEKGVPLALPISRSEVFPIIVSQMITVGEETGALDHVLEKMSDFYESEVEYMTNNLSTLLEPILLIIMGGVVAFVAASVYLPMFNIAGAI